MSSGRAPSDLVANVAFIVLELVNMAELPRLSFVVAKIALQVHCFSFTETSSCGYRSPLSILENIKV